MEALKHFLIFFKSGSKAGAIMPIVMEAGPRSTRLGAARRRLTSERKSDGLFQSLGHASSRKHVSDRLNRVVARQGRRGCNSNSWSRATSWPSPPTLAGGVLTVAGSPNRETIRVFARPDARSTGRPGRPREVGRFASAGVPVSPSPRATAESLRWTTPYFNRPPSRPATATNLSTPAAGPPRSSAAPALTSSSPAPAPRRSSAGPGPTSSTPAAAGHARGRARQESVFRGEAVDTVIAGPAIKSSTLASACPGRASRRS